MNIERFQHLPALPLLTGEDIPGHIFRRVYGVPVSSLPHVRESLAMMREASRELHDGCFRDSLAELEDEGEEEEHEADSPIDWEGGQVSLSLVRGYSARLTFDSEEGGDW
jgi:hypothetical protein